MNDNGSKNWQPCDAKWSNDATLTIPEVDICNKGSYRCVVSNLAGSQTSKPAKLEVSTNLLMQLIYSNLHFRLLLTKNVKFNVN